MGYERIEVPLQPQSTPGSLEELWRHVWEYVTDDLWTTVSQHPSARTLYHRYFDELLPENEERMRHVSPDGLAYSFWDFGGHLSMSMGVASSWFAMSLTTGFAAVDETCSRFGYSLDLTRLLTLEDALAHPQPLLLARDRLWAIDGDRLYDDESTLDATPAELERAASLVSSGASDDPVRALYVRQIERIRPRREEATQKRAGELAELRLFKHPLTQGEAEAIAEAVETGRTDLLMLMDRAQSSVGAAAALVFESLVAIHTALGSDSKLARELIEYLDSWTPDDPAAAEALLVALVEADGLSPERAWRRAICKLQQKAPDAIDAICDALKLKDLSLDYMILEDYEAEIEAARAKLG